MWLAPSAALAAFDPPEVQQENLARDIAALIGQHVDDAQVAAFFSSAAKLAIRTAPARMVRQLVELRNFHTAAMKNDLRIRGKHGTAPWVSGEFTESGLTVIHVDCFTGRFLPSFLETALTPGKKKSFMPTTAGNVAEMQRLSFVLTKDETQALVDEYFPFSRSPRYHAVSSDEVAMLGIEIGQGLQQAIALLKFWQGSLGKRYSSLKRTVLDLAPGLGRLGAYHPEKWSTRPCAADVARGVTGAMDPGAAAVGNARRTVLDAFGGMVEGAVRANETLTAQPRRRAFDAQRSARTSGARGILASSAAAAL